MLEFGQAGSYGELKAMVESIVVQVLGEKFAGGSSSWVARGSQVTPKLYAQTRDPEGPSGADQFFGAVGQLGQLADLGANIFHLKAVDNKTVDNKTEKIIDQVAWDKYKGWSKTASGLGGLAGMYGAYKSGDPISGALSGWQAFTGLGIGSGPVGAAIGFLAGLFGGPEEVDRWDRPKFRKADKAYDKLFTFDRGEEDEYYMPDSFYFRTGWRGARKIVVRVGNNQFDDHIRDSLTNSYATQLQRGLVF